MTKNIKFICRIKDVIDNIGADVKETRAFFAAIRALEQASGCKTEFNFNATSSETEKVSYIYILSEFDNAGLIGRINYCRFKNTMQRGESEPFPFPESQGYLDVVNDFKKLNTTEPEVVIYAGADAPTLNAALNHKTGPFGDVPRFFIDTNAKHSSFYAAPHYNKAGIGGIKALTEGIAAITQPYADLQKSKPQQTQLSLFDSDVIKTIQDMQVKIPAILPKK